MGSKCIFDPTENASQWNIADTKTQPVSSPKQSEKSANFCLKNFDRHSYRFVYRKLYVVYLFLASSRRSVSQGAAQKTVGEKIKKKRGERKRGVPRFQGSVSPRFFLFFRPLFSALRPDQLNAWKRLIYF